MCNGKRFIPRYSRAKAHNCVIGSAFALYVWSVQYLGIGRVLSYSPIPGEQLDTVKAFPVQRRDVKYIWATHYQLVPIEAVPEVINVVGKDFYTHYTIHKRTIQFQSLIHMSQFTPHYLHT